MIQLKVSLCHIFPSSASVCNISLPFKGSWASIHSRYPQFTSHQCATLCVWEIMMFRGWKVRCQQIPESIFLCWKVDVHGSNVWFHCCTDPDPLESRPCVKALQHASTKPLRKARIGGSKFRALYMSFAVARTLTTTIICSLLLGLGF